MGLANLGSESETCVGSRVHLVGVSVSFEKNFYRLPFTPPLSGSPYRSFISHLSKPLGKVLVSSSFFWCSSHAKWWPGGHLWLFSGELRRPAPPWAAARRRLTASRHSQPSICQPTIKSIQSPSQTSLYRSTKAAADIFAKESMFFL
jgi:hypothetical protein